MSEGDTLTVRDLRRRWKPNKQRLANARGDHPTNVRFHRACSWLQRVEELETDDFDTALTSQWTAFNALYGQWNEQVSEPHGDRECWRRFLDRILALDGERRVAALLIKHRRLVMSILDDAYLGKYFWADPANRDPTRTTRDRRQAGSWYVDKRWAMILECLLEHIYLLRCQLVHGAASYKSRLNRASIKHCTTMLGHLLAVLLLVWIDHGADEDWGLMCYPPMQ